MAEEIWIERALTKELQQKHADFTFKLLAFDFGPNKIRIQATIAQELLKIGEEQAKKTFEQLCRSFCEVCCEHHIKFDPVDVFVFANDGLRRGTSTKFRDAHDENLFAEVLIPASDFKMHEYWKYSFLHELGHSWFSIDFSPEDIEYGHDDLFIDLVVICAFRKILPPDKRVYKEVRKHRPYFLTQQSKRFIGKGLYKQILRDPEGYLRDLQQKIHAAHR